MGAKDWNWNKVREKMGAEGEGAAERDVLWPLVTRAKDEKGLLLYAQRGYLERRFIDYDPARQDLWKDHNRPWDYDHVLPSKFLYHKSKDSLRPLCDEWGYTIGNLRACPYEDNRSARAEVASKKIPEAELNDFFISPKEFPALSCDESLIRNTDKTTAFVGAVRDRILRIYAEWYDNLDIEFLIG